MKTVLTLSFIAFASIFATPGMAAMEGMDHGSHGTMVAQASAAAPTSSAMVDGVVKKVDKAAGKVTLTHGPLKNLGMDMGMTMAFRVKDVSWLDKMKEGDKIRFVADNPNGVYTVIQYESAK